MKVEVGSEVGVCLSHLLKLLLIRQLMNIAKGIKEIPTEEDRTVLSL